MCTFPSLHDLLITLLITVNPKFIVPQHICCFATCHYQNRQTPFLLACEAGHENTIRFLLTCDAQLVLTKDSVSEFGVSNIICTCYMYNFAILFSDLGIRMASCSYISIYIKKD